MTECERRLVRNLKEKEQELLQALKRIEALESEKKELASKIQILEQKSEDKAHEA